MATAALGGTLYPPGGAVDLQYFTTALPASALGAWLQSDGTWSSFSTARSFDLRPYSQVYLSMSLSALTGGASPTLSPLIIAVDWIEDTPANAGNLHQITPTTGIAAAGGSQQVYAGNANSVAIAGGSYSANTLFAPGRLLFCRLGITSSGGPTGITNGRLFFWGLR